MLVKQLRLRLRMCVCVCDCVFVNMYIRPCWHESRAAGRCTLHQRRRGSTGTTTTTTTRCYATGIITGNVGLTILCALVSLSHSLSLELPYPNSEIELKLQSAYSSMQTESMYIYNDLVCSFFFSSSECT